MSSAVVGYGGRSYFASTPSTSSSTYRRRDSSLGSSYGTLGRREASYASPMVTRRARDASVGATPNRNSVLFTNSGLGSETAKYNREMAMKEIQKNFQRDFAEAERKYHPTWAAVSGPNDDGGLTRARNGLLGHTLDEKMARKDALR